MGTSIRQKFSQWGARLAQPHVLLPTLGVVVLAVIWVTALHMIEVEQRAAERATAGSTLELLDTYEAQMLRNLREIDQALKVVKYAYESSRDAQVLAQLKSKALLPPDLLFAMAIIDASGRVVANTRPYAVATSGPGRRDAEGGSPEIWTSRPLNGGASEWQITFSRSIDDRAGRHGGSVTLSVDASYFVSGYERSKLGDTGLLGIAGLDDGSFLVRRSGDAVSSGGVVRTSSARDSFMEPVALRAVDPVDHITRLSATRSLYGFPLALVVGLGEEEQLAGVRSNAGSYRFRAMVASAVLLLVIGALVHSGWRVAQAQRRENEARLAHDERVQHLAYHDALTGLPNRALFSKMLEHAIANGKRHGTGFAVLFLDLDRFKQINDTLGHQIGDELLADLARRLTDSVRQTDTVARFGGDEFVVLLSQVHEDRYVAGVARKLLDVTAEPYKSRDRNLIGTASIGIALYPRDGDDEQTLMKHADVAMYHAKGQGKNNFQFFSESLQVNYLKRLTLETSLRQALEHEEFEVHYQPKIDFSTGALTGMEALVRWRSPEHGLVLPSDFIPIAEDTGLIVPIGLWVLETACAQNVRWQHPALPALRVAVNLSPRQFGQERLLEDISAVLNRTGMSPTLLELEITESMLAQDVEHAIRTLNSLSASGIHLAIDDFGTGYSSLSNLKRFPLNTLKIDRSFVSSLPDDIEGGAITQAIISMAKALDLTIVAEGVETHEQAEFLRHRGCDQYQGYFLSRPLAADAFEALLRHRANMDTNVVAFARTAP